MPESHDAVAAALRHAALGFGIFPVWSTEPDGTCRCPRGRACDQKPGKHPATAHGFHDATTDAGRIAAMLGNPGTGNYGMVPPVGIAVIDADADDWRERLTPLPVTKMTKTPSGADSWHVFVRTDRHDSIGGLVTRYHDTGYVVGPDSAINGRWYVDNGEAIADAPSGWSGRQRGSYESTGGFSGGKVGEGGRHDFIRDRARHLRGLGMGEDAIIAACADLNQRWCSPPLSVERLLRAIGNVGAFTAEGPTAAAGRRLMLKPADVMGVVRKDFLWPGVLPVGELVLLVGKWGLGKSQLATWMAAQVSNGVWGDPGSVIYITGEEDRHGQPLARAHAAGVDLSRLAYAYTVEEEHETVTSLLLDLRELEEAIRERQAKLLILDPLITFLAGADENREGEVRKVLAPLVTMAQSTGCTVLALSHINKRETSSIMHLIGASSAIQSLPRAILFMAELEDGMAFGLEKSSYAQREWMAYFEVEGVTIRDENGDDMPTSRVLVGEPLKRYIGDMLAEQDGKKTLTACAKWLNDWMEDNGNDVSSEDMHAAAEAEGFSRGQLASAQKRLGLESIRSGFPSTVRWRRQSGFTGARA